MANLTADKRKAMPPGEFAGPGKSFPVNDEEHARLAIGGATRSERAGNISASEAAGIKAKARRKLGKAPPSEGGRQTYAKGASTAGPLPQVATKKTKGPIPQGTLASMVKSLGQ